MTQQAVAAEPDNVAYLDSLGSASTDWVAMTRPSPTWKKRRREPAGMA